MQFFNPQSLSELWKPDNDSSGEDNGQVTIVGGSKLFHGAPTLSLKVASRFVDMVFFTSPEPSIGRVADLIKSRLMSFIWVPWEDVEAYVEKSDAVLIGPGMMRYGKEVQSSKFKMQNYSSKSKNYQHDKEGKKTREITKRLLTKFPNKKWVIDAGSLQVIDPELLPKGCIITPNVKEFEMLFGERVKRLESEKVKEKAEKYKCTIVLKGPETIVCSPGECTVVKGGNAGLTKGGTGDVLAGLTVALFAKNDAHLAACFASYIEKKAADELYKKVATNFNADDLADKISEVFAKSINT